MLFVSELQKSFRFRSSIQNYFLSTYRVPGRCWGCDEENQTGFLPWATRRGETGTTQTNITDRCRATVTAVGGGVEWGRAVSTQAGVPEETSSKKGRRPKDEEG